MPWFQGCHRQNCDVLNGCLKSLANNPWCCHFELVLFHAFGCFSSVAPAFPFTHCVNEANKVKFLWLGLKRLYKKNWFTNNRKTYLQLLLMDSNCGFALKCYFICSWTYLPRNTEHTGDVCWVHSGDMDIIQSLRYRQNSIQIINYIPFGRSENLTREAWEKLWIRSSEVPSIPKLVLL